jgi:hypothetical protein
MTVVVELLLLAIALRACLVGGAERAALGCWLLKSPSGER